MTIDELIELLEDLPSSALIKISRSKLVVIDRSGDVLGTIDFHLKEFINDDS